MKIEPKFLYPVLAIIPLLCLIYYVSEYMVDVPYWDHWERISLFEKSFEGTLTFTTCGYNNANTDPCSRDL